MKRVFAWIVCIGLVLGCVTVPVAAQEPAAEDWVFHLTGYGVLDGAELTEDGLNQPITRGEYSELVVKLFGLGINLSMEAVFPFTDVLPSETCYRSIAALAAYGLVSGDEELFRPGEAVLGTEAVKILVSALGYSPAAQEAGGYPAGYMALAARLGVQPGGAADQALTWRDAVQMLSRALDAEVMEEEFIGSGNFQVKSRRYLRDVLKGPGGEKYMHGWGVLDATSLTYLNEPVSDLGENQVTIENVIFDAGSTGADALVGAYVEYLALYDDKTGSARLTAVRADKKNREETVAAEDFLGAANGKISFALETGKTKELSYDKFAKLVRNQRLVLGYKAEDIAVKNGSMRLVDNNNDGKVDVIFIREYESAVVARTAADTLYFETGESLYGNQSLILEKDNPDLSYILRDAAGAAIKLEDIGEGDVISVLRSDDGEVYEIFVSKERTSGMVERVTALEDGVLELVIGGSTYRTEKGRKLDFQVGDTVEASLNFEKRIVQMEAGETTRQYGYLFGCASTGIDGYIARILVAGKLKAEVKVDDTDPDNPINVPYLRAGNADVIECMLADKVRIRKDGERLSVSDYLKLVESAEPDAEPDKEAAAAKVNQYRVIEYALNSKGEVQTIDLPERIGTGEERYYNSYEKTFGKLGDGFATNEETSVICVPINGVTDKRNLLGRLEMEANDQKYTISGYDLDAETEYAGLVVMLDRLNADAVTGALESSKPAVAEEVITTINEEGETVRQVTFWSEGKKMSYPIAETKAADDTLGQIRAGTVFYYTKNVSDELSEATILKQLDADMGYYNDHTGGTLFGQINELRYKKLDTVTNRFVHQLMVSTAEDGASLEKVNINVRNQPPIYCYSNRGGQTSVSIVEPEALRAGEYGGDKVFVGSKNEETEIVVVVD